MGKKKTRIKSKLMASSYKTRYMLQADARVVEKRKITGIELESLAREYPRIFKSGRSMTYHYVLFKGKNPELGYLEYKVVIYDSRKKVVYVS
jgi:hypothetical protein